MNSSRKATMKDMRNLSHTDGVAENVTKKVCSLKITGTEDGDPVICHGQLKRACSRNGQVKELSNGIAELATRKVSPSPCRRKLVIHFDIRNTVLVADSVTKVSVEQALNSFLTGVTWGNVRKDTEEWDWYSGTPSLTPPGPDTVTYYKHLERKLVKTPEDRQQLRFSTGDFTQRDIGRIFHPYFVKHLELLRWHHSTKEETERKLTMKGKDGSLYHYILPSFFKLLQYLHKLQRDFAIIFRTYGLDATNVLLSTEHMINGHHPQFPEAFNMNVNRIPGGICRNSAEGISIEVKTAEGDSVTSHRYSDERVIYDRLSKMEGVCAFKDDFLHWQQHGYHYTSGKPLWIDLGDDSVQHIIFDDNMRTYEDDNIIDLRLLRDNHASSLTKAELVDFEDVFMVQSDLMTSIENDDYFITKVKQCEENYAKLLDRRQTQNRRSDTEP